MRSPDFLDATRLFDEGCVKSRLDELTKHFVSKFAIEDMRRMTEEQKRAFKPVSIYPFSTPDINDMFSEKAREKAIEIFEAERQGYVDFHSARFKRHIENTVKRLSYMLYEVDAKGKVSKLKVFVKSVPNTEAIYKETPSMRTIQYVGDNDVERLNQINRVREHLNRLNRYAPYFTGELKPLWESAKEIATLEVVEVESDEKPKKQKKR